MRRKSLIDQVPLALLSAVLMAGAVAFFFFAMPMVLLEQGVIASGLPTLIAAAGPPLGVTARALVAGSFALASGGATCLMVTLVGMIGRPRRRVVRERDEADPVVAPSFSHPARRPIFAHSELGAPLSDVAEAPRPAWPEDAELDLLEFPEDDVLELVDPLVEAPPEPGSPPTEELPIATLMARLEAGAERRTAKKAASADAGNFDGVLRSALEELQRMAIR